MNATWSPRELELMDAAGELHIAVHRADGSLRRWTPIWVVRADGQVYVRTWYRRDTGWFGAALRSQRARVRVPGLEVGTVVEDVGDGPADLQDGIDAAYRAKYGRSAASSVVTASAVASSLRLSPER